MPSSSERVASLRDLPAHRREALLVRLGRDATGVSATRLRRQIEIVKRHVFGTESVATLCAELGVSQQRAFADRAEVLARIDTLLEREPAPTAAFVEERTGHVAVAQARALYDAGATLRARDVLRAVPLAGMPAIDRLEAVVLHADIASDLGASGDLASCARACDAWLGQAASDSPERMAASLAVAWIAALGYSATADPERFVIHMTHAVSAARALIADGAGRIEALLCRLLSDAAIALLEVGEWSRAEAALQEAADLTRSAADIPIAATALVHANRACVLSVDAGMLGTARRERAIAYDLALRNGLPRTLWVCLYLAIFEKIWLGEREDALAIALQLSASVEASDSVAWRRVANSRLSNAFSALGRIDDAERAIATFAPDDPAYALQRCALLLRRGFDRDAFAQAGRLATTYAHAPPAFAANVLFLGASASHRLSDARRATSDIEDAVSIYESAHTSSLFLTQRTYRLAYRVTGRPRYRDAALDLDAAFMGPAVSPAPTSSGMLTRRQLEIAHLAAAGATNRAIADRLGISVRTVGNHLAATFASLGVRARWQLESALRNTKMPAP
jgi:DNA-binding CsgD family transcriptional regulator